MTTTEETTSNAAQLDRAAHLADLGAMAHKAGVLAGWVDYIKAEAAAIGVSWERMERAIARRTSAKAAADEAHPT